MASFFQSSRSPLLRLWIGRSVAIADLTTLVVHAVVGGINDEDRVCLSRSDDAIVAVGEIWLGLALVVRRPDIIDGYEFEVKVGLQEARNGSSTCPALPSLYFMPVFESPLSTSNNAKVATCTKLIQLRVDYSLASSLANSSGVWTGMPQRVPTQTCAVVAAAAETGGSALTWQSGW